MLNEERVKLMTEMAKYENTLGEEDLKISTYYKKDYTSLHTLITILWLTVGYGLVVALAILSDLEKLMSSLTMERVILLGIMIIGVYIAVVIAYCIIAVSFYNNQYSKAKQRVKVYYRSLSRLGKLYMKEK